jgi:hypothetical protein
MEVRGHEEDADSENTDDTQNSHISLEYDGSPKREGTNIAWDKPNTTIARPCVLNMHYWLREMMLEYLIRMLRSQSRTGAPMNATTIMERFC